MKFHFDPQTSRIPFENVCSPLPFYLFHLFHRPFVPTKIRSRWCMKHTLLIVNHAPARVLLFARRFARARCFDNGLVYLRWLGWTRHKGKLILTLETRRCNFAYSMDDGIFTTFLNYCISHNKTYLSIMIIHKGWIQGNIRLFESIFRRILRIKIV